MAKTLLNIRLEDEVIALLDSICERDGMKRPKKVAALIRNDAAGLQPIPQNAPGLTDSGLREFDVSSKEVSEVTGVPDLSGKMPERMPAHEAHKILGCAEHGEKDCKRMSCAPADPNELVDVYTLEIKTEDIGNFKPVSAELQDRKFQIAGKRILQGTVKPARVKPTSVKRGKSKKTAPAPAALKKAKNLVRPGKRCQHNSPFVNGFSLCKARCKE